VGSSLSSKSGRARRSSNVAIPASRNRSARGPVRISPIRIASPTTRWGSQSRSRRRSQHRWTWQPSCAWGAPQPDWQVRPVLERGVPAPAQWKIQPYSPSPGRSDSTSATASSGVLPP
jgi:hypothetical protein